MSVIADGFLESWYRGEQASKRLRWNGPECATHSMGLRRYFNSYGYCDVWVERARAYSSTAPTRGVGYRIASASTTMVISFRWISPARADALTMTVAINGRRH
jgi:hypothetical protein